LLLSHEKIQKIVKERLEKKQSFKMETTRKRASSLETYNKKARSRIGMALAKVNFVINMGDDGKVIYDGYGYPTGIAGAFAAQEAGLKKADIEELKKSKPKSNSRIATFEKYKKLFENGLNSDTNAGTYGQFLSNGLFLWAELKLGTIESKTGTSLNSAEWVIDGWDSYREDLGWAAPEDAASDTKYIKTLREAGIQSSDGLTIFDWEKSGGTWGDFLRFFNFINGVAGASKPSAKRWPEQGSTAWDAAIEAAGERRSREFSESLGKQIILSSRQIANIPGGEYYSNESDYRADSFVQFSLSFSMYGNGDIVISEADALELGKHIHALAYVMAYAGPNGEYASGDSPISDYEGGNRLQWVAFRNALALGAFLRYCWVGKDMGSRKPAIDIAKSELTDARAYLNDTSNWTDPWTGSPSPVPTKSMVKGLITMIDALSKHSGREYHADVPHNYYKKLAEKGNRQVDVLEGATGLQSVERAVIISNMAYKASISKYKKEEGGSGAWGAVWKGLEAADWAGDAAKDAWNTIIKHWRSASAR
tara:strand:+ start:2199 stop:3809 length:1611 start_codon:yes stop_codon:yes gene_type:complete